MSDMQPSRLSVGPSVFCLVVAIIYMLQNDSGHTGFNPYMLLFIFVPSLLFGEWACYLNSKANTFSKQGIIATIFGIVFLVTIDAANILLPYEVWISRGML